MLQKYPLILFFGLAYLISWLIWLPLYLPAFGVHSLPVLSFQHTLGGIGPLLASFMSTRMLYRGKGIRKLVKAGFSWKPPALLILALLGPAVLNLLAALIVFIQSGSMPDLSGMGSSTEFPAYSVFGVFLYNLIFFGFGEEFGWRGFALPHLQSRYNALISSLILSVFWALWHWPLFFYRPGYVGMDLAAIGGWLFSLITGSVLLTWMFNGSRGSILICAVFHATIDMAFTSDFSNQWMVQYTGMLITVWGLAVIIWFKPRHLSRNRRITVKDAFKPAYPHHFKS